MIYDADVKSSRLKRTMSWADNEVGTLARLQVLLDQLEEGDTLTLELCAGLNGPRVDA